MTQEPASELQALLACERLEPGAVQLEIRDVSLRFGGINALTAVSAEIHQGAIHALIGPNGAGKTSLLNCISGLYRPQEGAISLHTADGRTRSLTGAAPAQIARWGVARSFQNIELFAHMTVLDNLLLGRHIHMRHRVVPALAWLPSTRRQEREHGAFARGILRLLGLEDVARRPVGSLAYGIQKQVELGRALCMDPALLLLDEPMAGLNDAEKHAMARQIVEVNARAGVTVVLIEHDMGVVMDLSDRVTVLDFGRVIASSTPEDVACDPAVVEAYLGAE